MKKAYQAPRIECIVNLPHHPLLEAGSYNLNGYYQEEKQVIGGDEE